MSVFVDEIVSDIKQNPKTWVRTKGGGYPTIEKDDISIQETGNSILFSIVDVVIDNKITPMSHLSFMDKVKLERVVKWWIKNATVEMLRIPNENK